MGGPIYATGTPAVIDIVLCLNGPGKISCEKLKVQATNLAISTTIPNKAYTSVGLRVDTAGYTPSGCTPISNGFCLFSTSDTTSHSIGLGITDYELVTIGNPGNFVNSVGLGRVDYVYKIGKYAVTIGQYAEFLNAVAKTDTYHLYHPEMRIDLNSAGISRSGSSGSYVYTVMDNQGSSVNRPITHVNWFDAARFANWMANSKPTGRLGATTTEDGTYALYGAVSGNGVVKNTINPNTGAPPSFYIPLQNEWSKAAYYSPRLNGGVGGYYRFATQSDATPGNRVGSEPNNMNYFLGVLSVSQSPSYYYAVQNYLTSVGVFTKSASFYGTFDQGGNVWEWSDLDGTTSPSRGLAGGHWFSGGQATETTLVMNDKLTSAFSDRGIRLASLSID